MLDRFQLALNSACKLTVPLNDAEMTVLKETLHIKLAQILVVHAENLQKWVGDGTLMQAFTITFPGYEERATQVRVQRELEAQQAKLRKPSIAEVVSMEEGSTPALEEDGSGAAGAEAEEEEDHPEGEEVREGQEEEDGQANEGEEEPTEPEEEGEHKQTDNLDPEAGEGAAEKPESAS